MGEMSRRLPFLCALLLVAMVDIAGAATVDKSDAPGPGPRQALLIANADYLDANVPLRHPIKDARAVGDELRRAGFEVTVGENLTNQSMRDAIADFRARIKPGSAALIFFSGYGIQVDKQNYLIPVNAQIWSESDVRRDGISLESVLLGMDRAAARVKLAIIDASRENPFERRYRVSSAGLTPLDASQGTMVIYAAAPEKTATEGNGENSLFVGELLKQLRSTGQTAEQIFMSAAQNVSRASDGRQVPWLSSSLAEDFHFTKWPVGAYPLPQGDEAAEPEEREPTIQDCSLAEQPISEQGGNGLAAGRGPCARPAHDELAKSEAGSDKDTASHRPLDGGATWKDQTPDRAAETTPQVSQLSEGLATQPSGSEIRPLLVQGSRWRSGEPVPLGVTLQGRADGAMVMITGLVPGMTLSAGDPVEAGAWQVPATELASTWIAPPENFVGAVDLVAELRLADTVAYRQRMHIEWIAPTAPDAPQRPGVAGEREALPAPNPLDRDSIAMLLERGKALLATGDLVAARLVLERAAESKDAEAALMLAASYDPLALREWKVYGLPGDIGLARAWYEKAKEFGSPEASRRLEILANRVP